MLTTYELERAISSSVRKNDSSFKVDKVRVFRYQLPLNYPLPLKSTRLTIRKGLLVELTDQNGKVAYGEAAPLPDFSSETIAEAEQALCQCCAELLGLEERYEYQSRQSFLYPSSVVYAVESALWGLGRKLWNTLPNVAPLLLGSEEAISHRLEFWCEEWPAEFKLKVGRCSIAEDIDRVCSVFKHIPINTFLRIDANQRWQFDEAVAFVEGLKSQLGEKNVTKRIAYIEEPTVSPCDFPAFFQETGVGYAFDESVQSGSTINFSLYEGLRAVILKPTLVGGVSYCKALIDSAHSAGVRVILSSSFESIVGVHYLQQLSSLWLPDEMPGLDTLSAFAENIVSTMPAPGKHLPETSISALELVWEACRS